MSNTIIKSFLRWCWLRQMVACESQRESGNETGMVSFERDKEFDTCVAEVEALINLIEGNVVEEREKEPATERKLRMNALRSILVSGHAVISGMSIADMERIFEAIRHDSLEQGSCDDEPEE